MSNTDIVIGGFIALISATPTFDSLSGYVSLSHTGQPLKKIVANHILSTADMASLRRHRNDILHHYILHLPVSHPYLYQILLLRLQESFSANILHYRETKGRTLEEIETVLGSKAGERVKSVITGVQAHDGYDADLRMRSTNGTLD